MSLLQIACCALYLCLWIIPTVVASLEPSDVVIVIVTQENDYHAQQAYKLRADLGNQAAQTNKSAATVRLLPEDFSHVGAWTLIPILPRLNQLDGVNSSWLVFCEERTHIDLTELVRALSQYDPAQEEWIGHGLHDQEPSIIHHFAFAENPRHFKYPLLPAGFAMSTTLLRRLAIKAESTKTDFAIDAAHEFAMFVESPLHHRPDVFCLSPQTRCASYVKPFPSCGKPVSDESIYFAVKTCSKFHKERIPVVQKTWARHAKHIEYFSDVEDALIPTTNVGVANTERGHCSKMIGILKLVAERAKTHPQLRWLVLADDDTLLSVPRLQALLACWPVTTEAVSVGERYGYNVQSVLGYNYLTGGGGLALSIPLVLRLIQSCHCPAPDTPDDMLLGVCLARLNLPLIHSPLFHQARPVDYSGSYLSTQSPVSFHKHWMLDPIQVYQQWFGQSDNSDHSASLLKHTEL